MKKFIFLLAIMAMLFTSSAFAQTTPTAVITGNAVGIIGPGGTIYPVSLSVQLVGCGPQVPVVPGGSIVTNFFKVAAPGPNYQASISVYGNDVITCGTQNYTTYAATWLINGQPAAPTATYRLTQGNTCNISDGTCKPIGFVPPVISKGAGLFCATGQQLLGFNADYTPNCQAFTANALPTFQTNGVTNTNQSLLNIIGSGGLSATASGGNITLNGSAFAQTNQVQKVFNVKNYGAVGDGVFDDSSAINLTINALDAAGGGVLYFPLGSYFSANCSFVLASSTIVKGDGASTRDSTSVPIDRTGISVPATVNTPGSTVICGSPTATLFTVTGNSGKFENISLLNTSGTTPTSGAAIFTNSSYHSQRIDYDNIWVWGFFDGVHVGVGNSWIMSNSQIYNNVRRALWIENTILSDAGDWTVTGNLFASGPRTGAGSAAVYQASSGGGKLLANKVNGLGSGSFTHGFWFNMFGSVQGQTIGNNIEVTSAEPIFIQHGFPWMTFTDNMLISPAGFAGIKSITGENNVYIGGGTINTLGAGAQYAVDFAASGQAITVAPFATNITSWGTALTNIVTDVSVNNFNLTSPDLTTRHAVANGTSVDIGGSFLANNTLSRGGELAMGSNGNGHPNWPNNSVLQADTNRVFNADGGTMYWQIGTVTKMTLDNNSFNLITPITGAIYLNLASTTGLPCTSSTNQGIFNYIAGGAGVSDTYQVCAKDASNVWAWRPVAPIGIQSVNIAGSRSAGTPFHNTSGRSVIVQGYFTTSAVGTAGVSCLDGVASITETLTANTFSTIIGGQAGFSCTIPSGYFYQINGTGTATALTTWYESSI